LFDSSDQIEEEIGDKDKKEESVRIRGVKETTIIA